MRPLMVAIGTVLAALAATATSNAQGAAPPGSRDMRAPPEMMEIDGSKNPELIPQWSAWEFAFRVIAGGPRELPTTVHRLVSIDEGAMILREAEMATKIAAVCETRMGKLRVLIGKERSTAAGRHSICGIVCWRISIRRRRPRSGPLWSLRKPARR
jgi:hypothetical protein